MSGNRKRTEWEHLRDEHARALREVCRKLGYTGRVNGKHPEKLHPIVQLLGSLAWGRYRGEPSPGEGKDTIVEAVGHLKGVRITALRTAELLKDTKARKLLSGVDQAVRIGMERRRR